MEYVTKGTKFRVIKDIPICAITSWGKPYTGSEETVIPKNTVMIAPYDQIVGTLAFGVIPEKYKEMEIQFISKKILANKDYAGYHFNFENEDYGRYFIYLDENKNDPSKYVAGEKIPARYTLVFKDSKSLKMIKNPTPDDIEKMVMLFISKNGSEILKSGYIILSKPIATNNITIISGKEGFNIEYQEGRERHKFQKNFKADEINKVLISYLDETNDWKKSI